jgi:plasmid replication initiation protein
MGSAIKDCRSCVNLTQEEGDPFHFIKIKSGRDIVGLEFLMAESRGDG